jgi:hypothetical protein
MSCIRAGSLPITFLRIIQDLHDLFFKLFRAASYQLIFILFADLAGIEPFNFIRIKAVMIKYSFYGMILIKDVLIAQPIACDTDFTDFFFHDIYLFKYTGFVKYGIS